MSRVGQSFSLDKNPLDAAIGGALAAVVVMTAYEFLPLEAARIGTAILVAVALVSGRVAERRVLSAKVSPLLLEYEPEQSDGKQADANHIQDHPEH